jgi:threonine dehydrogenase-like Zn-dependent dehydrogenase
MDRPGSLTVRDFPFPKTNEDTAMLHVSLCGICGTDKHIYKDESRTHPLGLPTKFPIIPGHEIVGTLENLGATAKKKMALDPSENIEEGDRVVPIVDLRCEDCWSCRMFPGWAVCEKGETYGWGISSKDPPYLFGGFSEYMYLLPNVRLVKVPDSVPDKLAVYAEVLAVGITSLQRALRSAEIYGEGTPFVGDIVIQGSGPLALAHIIAAKVIGAQRIIVVGKPKYRTEYLKQKFGVDEVFNVDETSDEERIRSVLDVLGGKGADLVVECTGYPEVVEEGLSYVKPFGTYVIAGIYTDLGRKSTVNVQKLISGKYTTVVGVPGQTNISYKAALKVLEKYSSRMPFDEIVTHSFPLEQIDQAMGKAISEESMKVAVNPNGA